MLVCQLRRPADRGCFPLSSSGGGQIQRQKERTDMEYEQRPTGYVLEGRDYHSSCVIVIIIFQAKACVRVYPLNTHPTNPTRTVLYRAQMPCSI